MPFATALAMVLGFGLPPHGASQEDEAVAAFRALYAVYDAAAMLEGLRADGTLPRISGPAELSRALFGNDRLAEYLVDPWGTALHVESAPGEGYVVASAGSDRLLDRSSWGQTAQTTSTADDIVLRDGRIVRSPEEWALGLANLTPERLDAESSRSKHALTVGSLRALISALLTYQAVAGTLPPVGDLEGLADHLVPDYMPSLPRTDAWNRPLDFAMVSTLDGYFLASAGADGKHGTPDDIVAEDGRITKNEELRAEDPLVDAFAGYQAARRRLEASQ